MAVVCQQCERTFDKESPMVMTLRLPPDLVERLRRLPSGRTAPWRT
jgi:hypothetical protein